MTTERPDAAAPADPCCGPGCCNPSNSTARSTQLGQAIRDTYGKTATGGLSSNHDGVRAIAEAFGYSPAELLSIPAEANMGLSCGNPLAIANLRSGEVVVDLGSGGGLDVLLAARKVGPTGRAIGIDMTAQMFEVAKKNAAAAGLTNVEFHLASIDRLPLADQSVDVVISNCVINLAPDKSAVFAEIARVLKPGGRVAVSDIALKKSLPSELATNVMAYIGCIAGAISIDDYVRGLGAAGLVEVAVIDSKADLNAYAAVKGQSACCSPAVSPATSPLPSDAGSCCAGSGQPSVHDGIADLLQKYDVNEYAASVKVFAVKAMQ